MNPHAVERHRLVPCGNQGWGSTKEKALAWFSHAAAFPVSSARAIRRRSRNARSRTLARTIASGAPLKAVSDRLGHTKSSISLDTYSHVLPDMQERVVEAINAALFHGEG